MGSNVGSEDAAYQRSGYGAQEIPLGGHVAVLSVDFQRGFTSGESNLADSAHVQAAVQQAARLLDKARGCEVPVFHTFVQWARSGLDLGLWSFTIPQLGSFWEGSGREAIDERILGPGDALLHKRKPSAFFGTGLDATLRELDIDTLVVCGVTTSGCVRATVVDAFSYGFRCVVAADGCGDQHAAAHLSNLADIRRRYANVWDVDEICGRVLEPRSTL